MALITNHPIYDALPISNDALDKGGVEVLRAAVVNEELFVTARCAVFAEPAHWGFLLADVARRLASLYAADGRATEAKVSAAIVRAFARSFHRSGARAKSKPSTRAVARKGARAKP
jgi:Domain of unknown function (DUF5076)